MFCSIYKWKVSRAMDSSKPLSAPVKHHLRRCTSCREFARLSDELERRLTEDAAALLESADASLGKRVMSSLDVRGRAESPARPTRLPLRPVLAMAASLTIVALSILWFTTSRSPKMPSLGPLFEFDAPRAYVANAMQKAESPYEKEIQEWKQAFKSTAAFLQARLEIGLGEETK